MQASKRSATANAGIHPAENAELTELLRGLKKVPAARGATVPARRPSVDAIPQPDPRNGAGNTSGEYAYSNAA